MDYKKNAYGNILIEYDSQKVIPADIDFDINNSIVICNAPANFEHSKIKYLISSTIQYGHIFGNKYAYENFPALREGISQGACAVLIAQFETKYYFILEQVKGRPYVMNAAGYQNVFDKTLTETAQREVYEETELKIKEWKPFAEWKFNMMFAGLKFVGYTLCGYSFVDLPKNWIPSKTSPVTIIPIVNDETESIILLDADTLQDILTPTYQKMLPSKLQGHHLNLLLRVAAITKIQKQDITIQYDDISYLPYFKFLEN